MTITVPLEIALMLRLAVTAYTRYMDTTCAEAKAMRVLADQIDALADEARRKIAAEEVDLTNPAGTNPIGSGF